MKSKNLRRLLAAVLCLVMVLSLFTACSKKEKDDDDDDEKEDEKTSSTYTAPLDAMMDLKNARTFDDYVTAQKKQTCGLLDEELSTILYFQQGQHINYQPSYFETTIENNEYQYGKDYTFYYEIDSKTQLDEDELTDFQEDIREDSEEIKEEYTDFDTAQFAEETGLSESQIEEICAAYLSISKILEKANLTEGYELEVTIYVKSKELDEPKEIESLSVTVGKVDGCWINLDDWTI